MRVGALKRIQAERLDTKRQRMVFSRYLPSPRDTVYVGLAGGSDPASMAIRHAQSFLRFDRRPSYFSEVFLLTGKGNGIVGCPVVGADPTKPETQGIIQARARRYEDPEEWPNRAVIGFTFLPVPQGTAPADRVARVFKAVAEPKAIRERYDLWDMLAGWQSFLFTPNRRPNPLVDRFPHPGAAFVRWALGMAGIEGAPGALDEFDAPEHFWAAANYWYRQYADPSVGVRLSLVRDVRDKAGTVSLP
jgi:hypothetical protein